MKTIDAVAFNREDLFEEFRNKLFHEIIYEMLSITRTGLLIGGDLCIFIDEDGSTKILKNTLVKPLF